MITLGIIESCEEIFFSLVGRKQSASVGSVCTFGAKWKAMRLFIVIKKA